MSRRSALPVALLSLALLTPAWPAGPAAAAAAPAAAAGQTLYVATGGSDSAPGTSARPVRTIGRAVSLAGAGDTIVVAGGTYHEGITIPDGKPLTIVGQGQVWLDGSRPVSRWRKADRGYVSRGWTPEFDASPTYTWGAPDNTEPGWQFVNPARPMAAHPDQVWIGGKPQRQVGSLSRLGPGRFYVDERGDRLHLGSNPGSKQVRASALAKAISIRAAGTRISNIDVRRFAPSVPHMGAVTAERARIELDRMTIRDNATTGLHVMGADSVLRRVRVIRNGMLGLSATHADDLRMAGVVARGNNTEGFNHSPVAGGVKIGRADGVRVVGGVFAGNNGNGLWFDEGMRRITVADALVRGNRHHGISLEISAVALVIDTVVADNTDNGIKVNNTRDVQIWNNTLVGNGRPINIVGDDRDPRLGPVEVHNNILAAPNGRANCLLCVEDYSGRFTATQIGVTASGNVYQRRAANRPTWAVVWSRGAANPAVFETVAAFARATGQESKHLDLVRRRALGASYRPTAVVRRNVRIAVPTPASLAGVARVPAAGKHLGAWLD